MLRSGSAAGRPNGGTRHVGTELDGFAWEISIDPNLPAVVILYRTKWRGFGGLVPVAIAAWEWCEAVEAYTIQVRQWLPVNGEPLQPQRDLPILSAMLRTELQP